MYHYLYDGTFEGLLTLIFEAYERKAWPDKIVNENQQQPSLFATHITIATDEAKAGRVWRGLLKKVSAVARLQLAKAFLSELPGIEMLVFQYVKLAFDSPINIEENYAADCVRELAQINKQVFREAHRMEAFVRFQKTADDLFCAGIEPDFNVIPLIEAHFVSRYADQRWLIYDLKRKYGIYYNLQEVVQVQFEKAPLERNGNIPECVLHEHELVYQQLWQAYFNSVNIRERKNIKLHLRHVPARYWKYLSEKRPTV